MILLIVEAVDHEDQPIYRVMGKLYRDPNMTTDNAIKMMERYFIDEQIVEDYDLRFSALMISEKSLKKWGAA